MADTSAVIEISATGGANAAAEIDKANQALNRTTSSSERLQSTFQHRFQHIGLMLFAGDSLRASGLGRESRMVIQSLNLALTEGAAAAGISSGGILLVVAALAALAGILVKVVQHHKEEYEALQKQIDANQKTLDSVEKTVGALDHYAASGGRLTQAQKNLLDASNKVAADLKSQQIVAIQAAITALEANRQKILDHAQAVAAWHKYIADVNVVWAFLVDRIKEALSPFEKIGHAIQAVAQHLASWSSSMTGLGQSLKVSGEDLKKMNAALDDNALKLAKERADLDAVKHGYSELGDAAIAAAQKELEGRKRIEDQIKKLIDAEHAHERQIMDQHIAQWIEHKQEEIDENEKALKQEQKAVEHYSAEIGRIWGHGFAQMLVEGKSFTDGMNQAFNQMAMRMIEQLIEILIKQAALWAWQVMTGTEGTGWGPGGGGGGDFGGFFASGGTALVDKPTLFMAGEAGPELASFTPLAEMGSETTGLTAGGTSISIGSVNTSVQGVNDPDQIARLVGQKIIQEIRGMGQLNFVRG